MENTLQELLRQAAKDAGVPEEDVQFRYDLTGMWVCIIRIYKKKGGYATDAEGSHEDPALAVSDALESVRIYRKIFAEDKDKKRFLLKKKKPGSFQL